MSLFARRNVKRTTSRKAALVEEDEAAGGGNNLRSPSDEGLCSLGAGGSFGRTSFAISSHSALGSASGSSRSDVGSGSAPASAAALATASHIREKAAVAAAKSHASSAAARPSASAFRDSSQRSQATFYSDLFDAYDGDDPPARDSSASSQSGRAATSGGGLHASRSERLGGSFARPGSSGDDASRRPGGGALGRGGLSFSGLDEEADREGEFFKVKKSKASKRLQREKEREARTDNLDRFEKGEVGAQTAAASDRSRGLSSGDSGSAKTSSKLVLQATGLRLLVNQTHLQKAQIAGVDSASERARASDPSDRRARGATSSGRDAAEKGSSSLPSRGRCSGADGGGGDRREAVAAARRKEEAAPFSGLPSERILSLAELEEAEARQRATHGDRNLQYGGSSGARGSRSQGADQEDDVASMARLARAQRQRARMIEKGELIPADSAAALTGEWGAAVRLQRRQQQQLEPLRSWRDGAAHDDEDQGEELDDGDLPGMKENGEDLDEDEQEEDPAARLKEQLQRLKVQQQADEDTNTGRNEEEEAWEAWEREKILKGAGRRHLLQQQQLMVQRQQEQQVYLQQQLLQRHHDGGGAPAQAIQLQLSLLQHQQQHQQRLLKQLASPQQRDGGMSAESVDASANLAILGADAATALGSTEPARAGTGRTSASSSLVEAPTSAAWLKEVWGVDGADAQVRAALEWLKEEGQQLRQLAEVEEDQREKRRRHRAAAADQLRVLEVRQLGVGKRLDDLQDFLIFVEDLSGFILAKESAVQLAQSTVEEMEREFTDRKFERRVLEFDDLRRVAFRRRQPRAGGAAGREGEVESSSESSSDTDSSGDIDEFGRSRKYTQKLQRSDREKARRERRLSKRQARGGTPSGDFRSTSPACSAAKALRRMRGGLGRRAASREAVTGEDGRGDRPGPAGSEQLWHVLRETLGEGWETSEDEEDDGGHRLRKDRSKFSAAALDVMGDVSDAFVSVASILEELEKMKKWCSAEFAQLKVLEQVPDMIKVQVRWQLLWWNPMAIAPAAAASNAAGKAEAAGEKEKKDPVWVCEASLENFDWFAELGLFIEKMDDLNAAVAQERAAPKEGKREGSEQDKSKREPTPDAYDPSNIMSDVVKQCVVPRVAAALKCTDITSFTSVNRASQLLGELLLFRDDNSLPHLTKVLQDFVSFFVAQLSALLPVEFVKQALSCLPASSSKQNHRALDNAGGDGTDGPQDSDARQEITQLYLHRALKVAGCCTCLVDILSDSLLLHICMQEILVDRIKPLLALLPPSRQLLLAGAFIHLLPLRWVIQLQQENPEESSSATPGRMQQLLGTVVALGEAVVDEDERAEVLLLLKKISPQEEAEKIQRVFEQRHGHKNPQQRP
ncbi:hypothetical protein BESB_041120 [Besnoitia besnoiti]|uniref:GCF C-terminal domain-containing protein n=1 Tax=Besnoitia besnoiti TaxID=94643 RepID=A0A2A9MKB9_BESBE|nr:hypothetical protein BESB_041120 [Besnoitia besnoiti]PFH37654.1 hypothetical protein BESB_041120 [Besnoitia besnoiti]